MVRIEIEGLENLERVFRELFEKEGLPFTKETKKTLKKRTRWFRSTINLTATGIWYITPKTIKICVDYADFFVERMGKRLKGSWRDNYVGLVGEKAFHLILQWFSIPCDYGEPIIDWRGVKFADFEIPSLGLVEAKTADYDKEDISINYKEWKGPRLVVAFRFIDEKPTKVEILGYMTKDEVESYKLTGEGRRKCWKIPIEDFRKHPCFKLFYMLIHVKEKIWEFQGKEGLIDIEPYL